MRKSACDSTEAAPADLPMFIRRLLIDQELAKGTSADVLKGRPHARALATSFRRGAWMVTPESALPRQPRGARSAASEQRSMSHPIAQSLGAQGDVRNREVATWVVSLLTA
eukprot:3748670-Pleurochrysis_carterae.AAC.1